MQRSRKAGRMVRWALKAFWSPVGAGVKSEEEVDALALYLLGDGPEGREAARSVDNSIGELPGLEGLRLLEGYVDAAIERAARRPGYAGVAAETPAVASPAGGISAPA
jgi:hypothetical protein